MVLEEKTVSKKRKSGQRGQPSIRNWVLKEGSQISPLQACGMSYSRGEQHRRGRLSSPRQWAELNSLPRAD